MLVCANRLFTTARLGDLGELQRPVEPLSRSLHGVIGRRGEIKQKRGFYGCFLSVSSFVSANRKQKSLGVNANTNGVSSCQQPVLAGGEDHVRSGWSVDKCAERVLESLDAYMEA